MRIIEIQALSNGAHNNMSMDYTIDLPDGWAIIPDGMEIPNTFPFVNIEVEGNQVVSMSAGVMPEPKPKPEPEPSEADDTASMLVDHEYRLTLLELGLSE